MDQLLGIKTTNLGERHHQPDDYHQHEVTPYWMLSSLFEKYTLKEGDEFVDFGSGQGRILFYVHHHFHLAVKGIEMNKQLYREALENKTAYIKNQESPVSQHAIQFNCCLAEDYEIKTTQNRFYFFNPFSVRIFMKVVANILKSFEEHNREMDIILYYPTPEYIEFLENHTSFKQILKVKVPGVYKINNRECFVIYRLGV